MKEMIFLITSVLIFSTGLKGQNYVLFPTENAQWNVLYIGTCEERPPDTTILRYTIHGDTTINDIAYKRLCLESGDTINPKIRAIGGIREVGKKIYYIGETVTFYTDNKEYLLYDFTKQIGDTIKHNLQGNFFSVVLDIDSVWVDGNYRKRYKVDNHYFYQNPDYIIEGIGSVNNGLLGHISDIPTCGYNYWEFICFKENGKSIYLNPSFSDCFASNLLMGGNLSKTYTQVKIYPNPVTYQLQIENNSNQNLFINIIDINGRSIIRRQLNEAKANLVLDISPGVYNVQITNNIGEIVFTQKIVKQ